MTSSSISRDSIFSYFFITPPKRNEWIFTLKNVINKTPTKMTRQWLCHPPQKKRWKSPEFNWGLVEHSPKTRRLLGEIFFLLERKLQNHGGWNREKESLENINGIILTDFLFNWVLKTLFFELMPKKQNFLGFWKLAQNQSSQPFAVGGFIDL